MTRSVLQTLGNKFQETIPLPTRTYKQLIQMHTKTLEKLMVEREAWQQTQGRTR